MSKRVPIVLESLPDASLEFEAAGGLSGIKLFADGKRLKRTKGRYTVPRSDGSTAEIRLKAGLDFTNPSIIHGSEEVRALSTLPVPLIILAMLPIGLVAGGAIGGAFGGGAFMLNMGLMRSDQALLVRVLLCIAITACAAGAWLAIAAAIRG